ncbi:MAG: N-formylglutamate amidohydrolase [Bacteroidetes bacterium]|nr:N-formylglutamate amidohydrolase [Bacteroidota bacterium]
MTKLVITCEHGGNKIPDEYKLLFKNSNKDLLTHRGYDLGALELFNELKPLADFYAASEISRLLVELNRSVHHKNLFSEITKHLKIAEKNKILKCYYYPYRKPVENKISDFVKKGHSVIHISVHSFTPVLNNNTRNCDIGLLYDPGRKLEKQFCRLYKNYFSKKYSTYKIRFNYPYLGTADGFTSYLRKIFSAEKYLGIELEVNQKLIMENEERDKLSIRIKEILINTINSV